MSVDAAVVKNEDKYIPTIDLRDYFDAYSEEKRAKVIEQVRTACLEHGFFQVEGHGVPVESQRRMFAACKALFDLPLEKKRRISLYKYSWRRGYEGPGEQQANDPHHGDFERDAKEGFFVGKELPLDQVDFGKGPNVWPPDLAENDFHRPVMEYYEHARKVGFKVMELLAVSLGHPPSVLKDFTTDAAMFLKLLRYPAHTWTDTRKFGSGQHTDYGGITILLQDPGQDGLEVWHEATHQWVELPALEDKFVINLGDMVQRWTGGEYKSTLHRVINKTGGERYAVPAFWHGDLDAKNPLDPNDTSDETVLEFIKKKFYKGGTPSTIERLQKLSRSIEQICEIEGVPGVSIGVLDHGETLWTESFGFRDNPKTAHPDVNTQYSIGHITMSMVAAGVGKLVDDGKLQWTMLLREIIPEIDHAGVYWTHTATIADILAHRCGLDGEIVTLLADGGNGDIQPCLEEFLKAIDRIPHPLPHRESWLMGPWGYKIAAHIIEHISGQSLHEYLQDQVFRPLGMTSTTLRPSFEGSNNVAEAHASLSNGHACPLEFQPNFANTLFEGSRGAYSTVSDLLVWTKETLAASQNTAASANTVLKQIPHIISNHIAMKNPSLLERSYGFGWARAQLPGIVGLLGGNSGIWEMPEQPVFGAGNQSRLMIYHQGGGPGHSSFVAIFPETRSAVVVLMNTTAVSDAADWIARLLIEGLFDFAKPTDYVRLAEEGKRRTIERFATLHNRLAEERIQGAPPLPLKCYVGKYENKDYKYRLEVTFSPESESNLMISFRGLDSQLYPLRHYHDQVFEWSMSFDEVRQSGRYDITDPSYYKIRFEIYPDNRASRIIWNIHGASVPGGLTFEWKDERLAEAWRAVHAGMNDFVSNTMHRIRY